MNSKTVLNKIITLLSREEVKFTYAKLADGTIVESATFDVGESIEVVTEDGKTPAPNGEHELFLKDEEGNEVRIRVIVEDGIITERENVEELEEETVEVDEEKQKEMNLEEEEIVEESPVAEAVAEAVVEEIQKKLEEMSYRIEELSNKVAKLEEVKEEEEVEMEEDEEELPKLDGAPVMASKVSVPTNKKSGKVKNLQSSFLSKLYN
jgi:DNA repair exonuclease SbcCD ATPase subunit